MAAGHHSLRGPQMKSVTLLQITSFNVLKSSTQYITFLLQEVAIWSAELHTLKMLQL